MGRAEDLQRDIADREHTLEDQLRKLQAMENRVSDLERQAADAGFRARGARQVFNASVQTITRLKLELDVELRRERELSLMGSSRRSRRISAVYGPRY